MPTQLELFREKIKSEMKPIGTEYIEAVLFLEGYTKGQLHWRMMSCLCAYLKGEPYDSYGDAELRMHLHKETQKITDILDEKIGLKIENTFRERPRHELEDYSEKLILEFCNLAFEVFPDKASILALEDAVPKPCKLNPPKLDSPISGMMG